MMSENLVAAVDPTPIPGPAWLFHFLLVFTFILHAIFMNLTLGGTWIAVVGQMLSGGRADDPRAVLARRLMGVNTYAISLAITTGIAPLLFVQVLYQQYFYTATILIAWVWLFFLVMLMLGYYAVYVFKLKSVPAGRGGVVWLGIAAVMFLLIAMVHVAVNLIHSQPEKWPAFAANPWSILGDAAYFPRLLHFVLAALGFTALIAAWWAVRQASKGNEVELNTVIARHAWKWALWTTVIQVADGFLLLFVLPKHVLLGIMQGGVATLGPLTLSILLAIGLLMMMAKVSNPVEKAGAVNGTLAAMILTIAVMSITRHQVRELYLAPVSSKYSIAAAPQWGNFVLFALLLVAGLATVGYMVRQVLGHPATGDEAA
jgi:hypothetical protein